MTTAREKLYEEMVAMVATPAGPSAEGEIRKVMTRYRVQTKPGVDIPAGTTARDALGDRMLELWRTQPPDIKTKIGTAIDEFRMQLKATSSPPGPAGNATRPPKPALGGAAASSARPALGGMGAMPGPAVEDDDDGVDRTDPRRPQPASNPGASPGAMAARPSTTNPPVAALGVGDPPAGMRTPGARPGRASAEPVAGGPRKRGRTRGECPKCHSMGVVLARSYSGDEYFSCIYCGWQAYKPTEEDDPNASLAVRLLGQSPSEGQSRE